MTSLQIISIKIIILAFIHKNYIIKFQRFHYFQSPGWKDMIFH